MDAVNMTDTLLGVVLGLISAIGALAAWIHTSHAKRVNVKFEKNDAAHEKLHEKVDATKEVAIETRAAVHHIIKHHEGIPPLVEREE